MLFATFCLLYADNVTSKSMLLGQFHSVFLLKWLIAVAVQLAVAGLLVPHVGHCGQCSASNHMHAHMHVGLSCTEPVAM